MKNEEKPMVRVAKGVDWLTLGNRVFIELKRKGYLLQAREFTDKAARLQNSTDILELAKGYVKVDFYEK